MKDWKKLIGTPELARIVADISTDGHLQIKGWRNLTSFYAKDMEEIKKLNQRFSIFNETGIIYDDKSGYTGNGYKIFFTSKKLAYFLKEVGVPVGNKTNNPFLVPNWIITGSSKTKAAYLSGIYDGEGSIFFTKQKNGKKRWRINLEFYKNKEILNSGIQFMEQLRTLFKEFNIKSSPVRTRKGNIRKDDSVSVGMIIDIEFTSFSNFYKYVGFFVPYKKQLLESVLCRGA